MTHRDRLQFFLTWLALGVAPLLIRPLWQPDEGRYAEIPREMLATGDWLTPRLNYVLYFEKPPLQYWLSAASMRLFGESAFAARLPLALATLLSMYAAWRLAGRLGAERPIWAPFAAASCLLLYACGQILTLDALFGALCAFSLAAAVEAVSLRFERCQGAQGPAGGPSGNGGVRGDTGGLGGVRGDTGAGGPSGNGGVRGDTDAGGPDGVRGDAGRPSDNGCVRGNGGGRRTVGWTLAFYVAAALAVLAKGPAALVLVGGALAVGLLAALGAAPAHRGLRRALLGTLLSPYGWLAFLAVAVPWFAMVEAANPGHARFFFYTEHFERFTTHRHARQGSKNPALDKLYFVPVVLLGAMPWLGFCLAGLGRAFRCVAFDAAGGRGPSPPDAPLRRWAALTLLAAFAWPVLFFSLSGSKLIPYVTPSMVPLIALAAAFGAGPPLRRAGAEMLALAAAFLAAAALVLFSPRGGSGWVADIQASGGGPWILFLALVMGLLGRWAVRAARGSRGGGRAGGLTAPRWMAWHCALLLALSVAAQRVNGPRASIDALVAAAPRENVQWISHGNYFQALPFLTKGRVTVVGHTGELGYGADRLAPEERDRWFEEDRAALTDVAARLRRERPGAPVWAVSDKRAWRRLPPEARAAWEVMGEAPNKVLLRLAE
jgi:4-amino-4-deoxy-L-arabinose transferase-like glycosyltransferase